MTELADSPTRLFTRTGIRVLILEEQEVIRHGLLAITALIPEITASIMSMETVRGVEPNGFDATLLSTSTLMDAEHAGIGLEHLRPMIVIVPTTQPQQLDIVTRRPANGYIMQAELTSSSLRAAVLQVISGQLAIPDAIVSYLLNRVRQDALPRPGLESLSSREAEVLRLLIAGASNKEIARKLGISVHGVKRHVSTLLNQFHSPNRVHLVSYVLQSGILS
jgi:two-component system, NarL family, nitrate/nitrite response regulator NarL